MNRLLYTMVFAGLIGANICWGNFGTSAFAFIIYLGLQFENLQS